VNLIEELRVALTPARRRVTFLLGGDASSSILRGDLETSASSKVFNDGLDDDDPFFLVKRLVVLSHGCSTLPHKYKSRVFNW
jgi:hypothetical protein